MADLFRVPPWLWKPPYIYITITIIWYLSSISIQISYPCSSISMIERRHSAFLRSETALAVRFGTRQQRQLFLQLGQFPVTSRCDRWCFNILRIYIYIYVGYMYIYIYMDNTYTYIHIYIYIRMMLYNNITLYYDLVSPCLMILSIFNLIL